MDQTNDLANKINNVQVDLAKILIKQLDTEGIYYDEFQNIAGYILEQMKKIKVEADLDIVLKDLVSKWNFFSPVAKVEEAKMAEGAPKDEQITAIKDQLLQLMNNQN